MAGEKVILTGFMGMGKSTIGSLSAEVLGVPYKDTDEWMEAAGIDVPELVKTDMAKFRETEARALQTILGEGAGVFSTGGGFVSTELGRRVLRESEVPVVWLNAPFEVAQERVMRDTGRERPLFSDVAKARELFEERLPWYEETATHIVDAEPLPPVVARQVVAIARTQIVD
jgi:shikimate kinase